MGKILSRILQIILLKNIPKRQNDGPFRRDGWIGAVRGIANGGSRAPMDIWKAFSGDVNLFANDFGQFWLFLSK